MNPLGCNTRNRWQVSDTTASLVRPQVAPRPVTVMAPPKQVTFDLARTAIIVIDMQNDFCHPEGWLAGIGVDITPARAPIAPLARLLPALRGADVPVVWVNWGNRKDLANIPPSLLHVYDPAGQGVGLGGTLPVRGARVLEQGSWSAGIVDELVPAPDDIHIDKYRMSGFWDTMLDSVLRNLRVDTLLFAGVNMDQCVMATLQDASCLGYDCILLEDCAATTSPDFCARATVYNVRQCFGFVTSSDECLRAMKDAPAA
ncbi:Peroxyureidoacrylate/ureidoacrylate amidohydrolase RutB [Gluconacetobacter sp. SXCC-1]|mgnify:FL=1|uniref:Isochorismatase family protein n=1 Tax=Komagataeibacter rhaeticus TaxID=215221 RepID=A0A181CAM8_9PROT|nr:isochorismatase family cysteine hydrolase [Komagataeibacter rhaeticus]ATU72798.1 isochorismatase [Komagataeibacter xylinus]EGG76482.1 Peroxyureidoacrylate/ureidoacrylate amidohydrolase RutB [Gluconacetobacter sp. SXCC-1]QIP35396.1 isochorismatase family protein [Komagataeibacter rhaeticus]QOC47964.1 isochorismatase family protein [Komagataeibacter rhaeticus]WPP22578.1 isochorismatase family cysteine hydrolase [Komagataeibacter rhaeticus]